MISKLKTAIFKYLLILFCLCDIPLSSFSQGFNHNWLFGYDVALFDTNVTSTKAWVKIDSSLISVIPDNFKMPFRAAQGNISDENGNLLMISNGCWIADATGDTMQNGGGLNPNSFTSSWCGNTSGIPFQHSNVILPYPDQADKYVLFHQSGSSSTNIKSSHLYYSVIDMSLNGGLGGVISGEKNLVALQAGLNPGLAVCKHANGRDWWVIAFKDSSDIVYKFLLSPTGVGSPIQQALGVSPFPVYLLGQMNFSPNGKRMAYSYYEGIQGSLDYTIRIFDFNRCSGQFSNPTIVSFTETHPGLGLSFSGNSKYLYVSTTRKIIQMNLDTSNIAASLDTVAIYDGYAFPYPFLQTDFWHMYLAANGKIYISSGNSVIDLHYINYPDSSGLSCDVQQHALHLPCYSVRGNVYHPNYYLGCDTTLGCPCLITGIEELNNHDFRFSISPNPNTGNFSIAYLLPQNKTGMVEIQDLNGKIVYEQLLPPWSTMQQIRLPENIHSGVYNCSIISDNFRVNRKIAVIR